MKETIKAENTNLKLWNRILVFLAPLLWFVLVSLRPPVLHPDQQQAHQGDRDEND